MKTRVVHCKREKYDIYIGRGTEANPRGPSKWGNPFEIGKDGTREEVIEKYRKWLLNQPDLLKDIRELAGKTLGCWCKTSQGIACHGDILAELADREWFKDNFK